MMNIMQKIYEKALLWATCGTSGYSTVAGIIASLWGIALALLFFVIHRLTMLNTSILYLFALAVTLLIIELALHAPNISHEDIRHACVIDRIIGIALIFSGLPLSVAAWKMIIVGVLLFYFFLYTWSLFLSHSFFMRISSMNNAFGVVWDDICCGLFVRGIIELILFIGY